MSFTLQSCGRASCGSHLGVHHRERNLEPSHNEWGHGESGRGGISSSRARCRDRRGQCGVLCVHSAKADCEADHRETDLSCVEDFSGHLDDHTVGFCTNSGTNSSSQTTSLRSTDPGLVQPGPTPLPIFTSRIRPRLAQDPEPDERMLRSCRAAERPRRLKRADLQFATNGQTSNTSTPDNAPVYRADGTLTYVPNLGTNAKVWPTAPPVTCRRLLPIHRVD